VSDAADILSHRLRAIRFGRLSSPELFASARLADGEVVWESGNCCVRASINELLDTMQMN
jgi:hypothetical protein